MIDDALRPDPSQPVSIDQGSGTPSEPLAKDTRGDALDRAWANVSPAWKVMAVSGRRSRSLVGTGPQRLNTHQLILMIVGGVSALALSYVLPKPYRLIYNASGSMPIGFYLTAGRPTPRRGVLMLVALPEPWRRVAAGRGYLPLSVMALKRVVGGPGDVVCGYGARVFLNGRFAAARSLRDAAGRTMPRWAGCIRLGGDQWFLLNPAARSFDSRYIGPVPGAALRAEVVAL